MNRRRFCAAVCLFAAAVTGCASIDGVYRPDCAAFEGDVVTLKSGEFVWERFTDAVEIDADGKRIDPFPDYPIQGRYSRSGDRLELVTNDGRTLGPMFTYGGGAAPAYLLTADQYQTLTDDGQHDGCVLMRRNSRN